MSDVVQSVEPDITDIQLPEAEEVLCTDGSSFVQDRIWYAGPQLSPWTGQFEPSLSAQGLQLKGRVSEVNPGTSL